MELKHICNKTLLNDIKILVGKERCLLVEILHHLREIHARKLYSDVKCGSLYEYCIKELGFDEASAMRRIHAARLLAELPEIEPAIGHARLSLSNLSMCARIFKEKKLQDREMKLRILKQIENMSRRDCEKKLFEIFKIEKKVKEGSARVSMNEVALTMIVSDETHEKLQRLRNFLGHDLSMNQLLSFMADAGLEVLEKKKFKVTDHPKTQTALAQAKRTIPNQLKRQVYLRDKKCQKCGSTYKLNYDHRQPLALGGKTDEQNLRILCFNCNQRERMRAKL